MKFEKLHLFLILLLALLMAPLIRIVTEGFSDGLSRDELPDGDDDLYIKKSEIVPPVCPKCPDSTACPRQKACPPCVPCGRCPEPSFECKKVPNYSSAHNSMLPSAGILQEGGLPLPRLNSFSHF
jgi:hypothetical protein